MADYTDKIDALFSLATELGFTEQDFAELAIAAADQSGASADEQSQIERILGLALDECADCGGSTAPGSPDPHECAPAPLTADTITEERIHELRKQAFANGMQTTVLICTVALGEERWDDDLRGYRNPTPDEQRNCRARCAEILNARKARR